MNVYQLRQWWCPLLMRNLLFKLYGLIKYTYEIEMSQHNENCSCCIRSIYALSEQFYVCSLLLCDDLNAFVCAIPVTSYIQVAEFLFINLQQFQIQTNT